MLYATSSCDNVKAFHTLGRRYGIPSFGMERPYYPFTPHAMEHWKNEHKRLIAFLEEQTGKKMDYDRLKETVRLSYRLTEICLEIDKLVAHVPTPMSPECFGGVLLAIRLMCGTQEAVDYLTELRDGTPGTRGQGHRRRQAGTLPGDVEQLHPVLGPDAHGLHAAEVRSGLRVRGAVALARGGQLDARSG